MSAAAAESEVDVEEAAAPLRPAPPSQAIFQSNRDELVLVVEKDPSSIGPGGEKVFGTGRHVQFHDGHLRVPFSGFTKGTRGEPIDVKELLLFLEGGTDADGNEVPPHPMFGNKEEGFWRHHEAPPAVSVDEEDELLVYAEERDVEGIERFIEAERSGWNRPALLEVAERTLARVQARIEGDAS